MAECTVFDAYLQGTIGYTSKISLHRLVNNLVSEGIATKKKSTTDEGKVYIGHKSDEESVQLCMEQLPNTLKKIEEWEFNNYYRYSMLFDIEGFSEDMLHRLEEENRIVMYDDLQEYENLYVDTIMPSVKREENNIVFKFNIKLDAKNILNEDVKRRYSVVAFLYREENILELRFNAVEEIFSKERFRFAYSALGWFRHYLKIRIEPIDFRDSTEYLKENGAEYKVVLSGEDIRMASGAKATIDIGNDEKNILPFIGELKEIMTENLELFEQSPQIKSILEDFIYEKENLSDFPWVKFKFQERNLEVKFTFDYGRENVCLLQHFNSQLKRNSGRERMDYVSGIIIKIRKLVNGVNFDRD